MENLPVSPKLPNVQAKPQKSDAAGPPVAAAEAPADKAPASFGSLLAEQIALSKPKEDAVAAVVAESVEQPLQLDPAAALQAELAQAVTDPALAQPQALPAQVPVHAQANFAEAMAKAGSAGGKELPAVAAGAAKSAAFEHAQALAKNPHLALQAEPEQFAAVLAEHADAVLPDATPDSAPALPSPVQSGALGVAAEKAAHATQPTLTVPQRVGAENWGTGLGDKVVWVVGNQMRGAEIHLNPPALGPLEVRIQISDGQANVSFMTQHAAVREALEAATPKLREMLGDNGISMGSVSVNVGTFAQQQRQAEAEGRPQGPWMLNGAEVDVEEITTYLQPQRGRGTGMVDFFA